jgi:hypothetical protein
MSVKRITEIMAAPTYSGQIGSIKPLDIDKLMNAPGEFYNKRKLEMDDYYPDQSGLDWWF